jgi:hypothetical protein
MTKRPLRDAEKTIIRRFAEMLPVEHQRQLLSDMENATAESLVDDDSLVAFYLYGYQRPAQKGLRQYAVEGRVADRAGNQLTVCLYADGNDRLCELEVIRWDTTAKIDADWSKLELY